MNERFFCTNCHYMGELSLNAKCAKCGSDAVVSEHALSNALKNLTPNRDANSSQAPPVTTATQPTPAPPPVVYDIEAIRRFLVALGGETFTNLNSWWDGAFWEWQRPLDANALEKLLNTPRSTFPSSIETRLTLNNQNFEERTLVLTWTFEGVSLLPPEPEEKPEEKDPQSKEVPREASPLES